MVTVSPHLAARAITFRMLFASALRVPHRMTTEQGVSASRFAIIPAGRMCRPIGSVRVYAKLTNANRSFPAAQNCAEPKQTS